MKKMIYLLAIIILFSSISCQRYPDKKDILTQVSVLTPKSHDNVMFSSVFHGLAKYRMSYISRIGEITGLSALLQGDYDGEITYGELKKYGDFGLGTFNSLDGEMFPAIICIF